MREVGAAGRTMGNARNKRRQLEKGGVNGGRQHPRISRKKLQRRSLVSLRHERNEDFILKVQLPEVQAPTYDVTVSLMSSSFHDDKCEVSQAVKVALLCCSARSLLIHYHRTFHLDVPRYVSARQAKT